MKRRLIGATVAAAALTLCGSAKAQLQGPFANTEFSATMVLSVPGEPAGATMKIYRSGDTVRSEFSQMGKQAYFLSVLSKHTGYLVMGPGMCMEVHQSDPNHPNPFEVTGKVQRKELGTDTVDGHPVKIEQITVSSSDGKTVTMKAWEATDLRQFPVRVEMPTQRGTARLDFKDVDLSTPSASLFKTPTNCRQMPTMPGVPH